MKIKFVNIVIARITQKKLKTTFPLRPQLINEKGKLHLQESDVKMMKLTKKRKNLKKKNTT